MTTQQSRRVVGLARTNAALTVALAVALAALAAGGMPPSQCRYAPALSQSANDPAERTIQRLSIPVPLKD